MQEIEDYLMNNDASVNVQSFLGNKGIEYEAYITKNPAAIDKHPELICHAHSLMSFEDVLYLLSIALSVSK